MGSIKRDKKFVESLNHTHFKNSLAVSMHLLQHRPSFLNDMATYTNISAIGNQYFTAYCEHSKLSL